jgi:acyl-CoA synthetase (AMP-forming)/AMP-acid ligase II
VAGTTPASRSHPWRLATLRRAGAIEPHSLLTAIGTLPRLAGRGGSLGVVSHINARAFGYKPAIHDRRGTLTWAELDGRANRLARALTEEGVRPGDRVAALLRNGRELVEVFLATQKLGVAACPLNTWAKTAELRSSFDSSGPSFLVYESQHGAQVAEAAPRDLPRVAVGYDGVRDTYEELLRGQSPRPLPPVTLRRGKPRYLIHTSGTVGRPKGALRGTGRQELGPLLDLMAVVPFHRRDVILCPAPMFHSFGILNITIGTLLGSTFVLPERFDADETLELAERHAATACAFVPVMLHRTVSLPEAALRHDLSSVRIVIVSGSSLSPSLRERATEVFGDTLYDLYGSTEAGWVAVATPEDIAKRPDSVGRPVPGAEVVVLGEDGEPVGPDQVGRIYVRSEARFEGYTDGEDTDERGDLFGLGDLGHLDEEGFLHVEGRADDMVVVGGENVYPIEVEEVIRGVEGVEDVAVTGVPDPEYGRVLTAFVTGRASQERILSACREALASYKVPRRVERLRELPRTGSGKVLVRELVAGLTEKE